MGDTSHEQYRRELVASPATEPGDVRLRMALKVLGQRFGLRCTRAEEVGTKPETMANGVVESEGEATSA
jgi:hypothetical protein